MNHLIPGQSVLVDHLLGEIPWVIFTPRNVVLFHELLECVYIQMMLGWAMRSSLRAVDSPKIGTRKVTFAEVLVSQSDASVHLLHHFFRVVNLSIPTQNGRRTIPHTVIERERLLGTSKTLLESGFGVVEVDSRTKIITRRERHVGIIH